MAENSVKAEVNEEDITKASQVEIDLQHEGTAIELRIRDDGKGFDSEQTISSGHYGLGMMRERAEAVGALLTVTSQPRHGTELVMHWKKELLKETT